MPPNFCNARPARLVHADATLDRAAAGAYGWAEPWAAGMADDDILARLFRLNQDRAARHVGAGTD